MSQYKELASVLVALAKQLDMDGVNVSQSLNRSAAILRSLDAQPVAVYHGRCVIDCGENGHNDVEMLKMIPAGTKLYSAPIAAQPTEPEELRKLFKDFPLNDRDVPIIYDTNEIDLITYALTGDDGEDDSVTVLQRLVRALPGKTVYSLLEDAETAAQPQQAKPEPLTADDLKEPKNGKQWRVEWWNESCRMMLPAGSKLDGFVSYKNGTLQFTIKKTDHGIKEQG